MHTHMHIYRKCLETPTTGTTLLTTVRQFWQSVGVTLSAKQVRTMLTYANLTVVYPLMLALRSWEASL